MELIEAALAHAKALPGRYAADRHGARATEEDARRWELRDHAAVGSGVAIRPIRHSGRWKAFLKRVLPGLCDPDANDLAHLVAVYRSIALCPREAVTYKVE